MTEKIRILFLSPNAGVNSDIRFASEVREIKLKLELGSHRDYFELISSPTVSPDDLRTALLEHRPNILHFTGFATKSQGIGSINDFCGLEPIGMKSLIHLLRTIREHLRIVLFSAFYANLQPQALSEEIDYIISMRKPLSDEAAIKFSAAFYRGLSFDQSVQRSFELALAQLEINRSPDAEAPQLRVRSGAVGTEQFLVPLQQLRLEATKSSVTRLLGGESSEIDREIVQREFLGGRVTFDPAGYDLVIEDETEMTPRVSCDDDQIRIRLTASEFLHVQEQLFPSLPGIPPPMPPFVFVGHEDALQDVRKLLRPAPGKFNITVIRGWPGVGKTTLLSVIGRDAQVAKLFPDGVLWTSLEQNPNLLSEIARWGRALGTDEIFRTSTLKEATTQLGALLRQRRILLIVDNVWTTADALPFTEVIGEQCALLVATRVTSVAENLTSAENQKYSLPVLTEEEALRLLRIAVPIVVRQYPDECRQLVRVLECLPLAIHIAGGLLRSETRKGLGVRNLIAEIEDGAKQIGSLAPSDRVEGNVIPTLSALFMETTERLDENSRECFAFLGAFAPKPATFDLEALKAVWEVEDPKPIVRKLVGAGLLEALGSGRFQVHRILVDHARSLLSSTETGYE